MAAETLQLTTGELEELVHVQNAIVCGLKRGQNAGLLDAEEEVLVWLVELHRVATAIEQGGVSAAAPRKSLTLH